MMRRAAPSGAAVALGTGGGKVHPGASAIRTARGSAASCWKATDTASTTGIMKARISAESKPTLRFVRLRSYAKGDDRAPAARPRELRERDHANGASAAARASERAGESEGRSPSGKDLPLRGFEPRSRG